MSVVITATDFSSIAKNAVHFACHFAQSLNASLTVVHSFIIPVTFNDNPMPVMPIEEGRLLAEEQMAGLVRELKQSFPGLDVNQYITYGDITDSLQEYTQSTMPLAIVVGNSSSEDPTYWLGSNLMATLKNLPYPVIAVPPEASYKPIHKLCFACDFKEVSAHLPATDLINLVNLTGAELHVLNVDHDNKEFGTQTPIESTALHQMLAPVQPQYHCIDNVDVAEGIQNFVETNKMDWLIVVPHKHPFFESLFHKSRTKAIVRLSHIPVVALHEKDSH
jgi:nucleotide-binding universal stress UspA family protein